MDLEDSEGNSRYAEYSYFRISSEEDGYRLFIDGYSRNAGDSLTYHNGQRFSTQDRDNDSNPGECAVTIKGPWWHNSCYATCLTVHYYEGAHDHVWQGISWRGWKGLNYSYKRAEMKIKPRQ